MSEFDEAKCVAGCQHFDLGERRHHKDCIYYPESLSKLLDQLSAKLAAAEARVKELELQLQEEHICCDQDMALIKDSKGNYFKYEKCSYTRMTHRQIREVEKKELQNLRKANSELVEGVEKYLNACTGADSEELHALLDLQDLFAKHAPKNSDND